MNARRTMLVVVFVVMATLATSGVKADFTFGEPVNLGPTVNSPFSEWPPSISADGLLLLFCSDRPGGHGNRDIWVSTRPTVSDAWGESANLGPIVNSSAKDAFPSISTDGLSLFFESTRSGGYGGHDVWVTTRPTVSSPWGPPVNLGPTVNSSYQDATPRISADGLSLFFESNRSGGYGDFDLWVTTRSTNFEPWGTPVNLGSIVNSPAWDGGPSLSADGLALCFWSDRPGGYGLNDLWFTTRKTIHEGWSTPVNLGPMVNTPAYEDPGSISADGRLLFFDSDRSGGVGGDDLWQAPILPVVDFNADEVVDFADLVLLIDNWGTDNTLYDIGPFAWGDGVVDIEDLKVFITHWEKSDPANSQDEQ